MRLARAGQGLLVGVAGCLPPPTPRPLPSPPPRSSNISDSTTQNFTVYGGRFNISAAGAHPEDHGTSHLSVVDADR